MNAKRNPLYIIIAVLTMLAMIMAMASCSGKEAKNDEDEDGGRKNKTSENSENNEDEGSSRSSKSPVSYREAEGAFIKNGFASSYSPLFAMTQSIQNQGAQVKIEFTPEEYLLDLMRSSGLEISSVNPTVLEMNSAINGTDVYSGIVYANGNKELLNLEVWLNGGQMIMSMPELYGKYLVGDLDDEGSLTDMMAMYGLNLNGDMLEGVALPSDREVERVLAAAEDEYFNLTAGAPTTENVEVSLGGISVNATKTDVELDGMDIAKITVAFLKALNDSAEIKDYIEEYVKNSMPYVYYDNYYEVMYYGSGGELTTSFDITQSLNDAISEMEEEISTQGVSDDLALKMSVYVAGPDVVKRDISMVDSYNGEENAFISMTTLEQGSNYATEIIFTSEDSSMTATDIGTKSGDSYSGNMEITTTGEEYVYDYETYEGSYVDKTVSCSVSYSDVSVDKDGNPKSGEITFSTNDMADESFVIDLKFRKDSFGGSLTVGGVKFATVEMSWNSNYGGKPAPSINANNSVDINGDMSGEPEPDLEAWLDTLDVNGTYDLIGLLFANVIPAYNSMANSYSNYDYDDYGETFDPTVDYGDYQVVR